MSQTTIDPKDLCVGSYVKHFDGRIIEVKGIGKCLAGQEVGKPETYGYFSYSNFQPIPITPEWLENLGFVDCDNRFELEGGYEDSDESYTACSINWAQTSDYFVFTDASERRFDIAIRSVHHLQAVFWNLERHWLAVNQKEVSRV
ncbi:hypothetical protein [Spirosoma aerolatum]|uniref:hypothetical protein n=1 Tax=Spirosoma aerolatum TaxID=1211326 RepID=UPI0009AD2890|nr:hypothetical protein [Spirosoma aerolatum]